MSTPVNCGGLSKAGMPSDVDSHELLLADTEAGAGKATSLDGGDNW
jgi:hypothetical protein